jgi:pyridoxine kinase
MVLQDISGFGRCSMTIALPVLSAMGCQCCPLPTAYLSTHTGFDGNTFLDMTQAVEDAAAHWKAMELDFDGIYSGFLGSERQVELVARCLSDFQGRETVILIDPVMGDHGKLYRTYTPALCAGMSDLAAKAQVITPNLTEAALLLGLAPNARPNGPKELEAWAARLSLDGHRQVVITGVSPEPGLTGALCLDGQGLSWVTCPEEPVQFHGTGDLFASVLLGSLLRRNPLTIAARQAVNFTALCIRHTAEAATPPAYGVEFEGLLGQLL